MNFLVLKELLEVLESFAALGKEAFVLLSADPVLDNVRELVRQDILNGLLFLSLALKKWIKFDAFLQVGRLLFLWVATGCMLLFFQL